MSKCVIEQLKNISSLSPQKYQSSIATPKLVGVIGEINSLGYDEFLKVYEYVKGSNLPPGLKEILMPELEIGFYTRKRS